MVSVPNGVESPSEGNTDGGRVPKELQCMNRCSGETIVRRITAGSYL